MTEQVPPEKESGKKEKDDEKIADIVLNQQEVQSAVKKLAEKKPEKLLEFMAMEMSASGNPLHQKMTPEHVSQVLDLAAKHDEREYTLHKTSLENEHSDGKSNRAYFFSSFIVVSSHIQL